MCAIGFPIKEHLHWDEFTADNSNYGSSGAVQSPRSESSVSRVLGPQSIIQRFMQNSYTNLFTNVFTGWGIWPVYCRVPEFVREKRFGNWLKDARDWAISRNRYWGTPIPLWVSEDFKEVRLAMYPCVDFCWCLFLFVLSEYGVKEYGFFFLCPFLISSRTSKTMHLMKIKWVDEMETLP